MKRLIVVAVAAAALILLCAAPAFATDKVGPDDQQVEVVLPIQLQVLNALSVEFKGNTTQDGFDLGTVLPEDYASDWGDLLVKSNDDFTKTFTWTPLVWQGEIADYPNADPDNTEEPGEIHPPILPCVYAGSEQLSSGQKVELPAGEWAECITVGAQAGWVNHGGVYNGTMTVVVSQQ